MYRYRHGYGGATPRHTSDNHTVTHTFFNFTHTAPLSLYAESATHADLRSLLSREPLVCLPDTHNSRASLTHDGGLARTRRASPCPLPCPLLALDAADQTRYVLVSSQGCHLIEAPCVNRRGLRSWLPLRGTLQGSHCAREDLWPIGNHGDGWSHVVVLSHDGDVDSLGEGFN